MVDCGFRGMGCYKVDYAFLNQTPQTPWCKGTHCSGKADGNGFRGNFCADADGRNHYITKRYSITLICTSLDIFFPGSHFFSLLKFHSTSDNIFSKSPLFFAAESTGTVFVVFREEP